MCAGICAYYFAISRHPLILRLDDTNLRTGNNLNEFIVHDFAGLVTLAPEIYPVHISVSEPQGAVVYVVAVFVLNFFHRPVAGYAIARRPNHGIKIGTRDIFEVIFRK
jgi:hypothetical protein